MKVRPDEFWGIIPRKEPTKWVRLLKNAAGNEVQAKATDHYAWQAAEYITELENTLLKLYELRRELGNTTWQRDAYIKQTGEILTKIKDKIDER